MEVATREERDVLERLQVEGEALKAQLLSAPAELEQALAQAAAAEQERDALIEAVNTRDRGLFELRDQVHWLNGSARRGRSLASWFALPRYMTKVAVVGIGGVALAIWLVVWITGVFR